MVFPWRWYYHVPSTAFWALVVLPLVLIKENRRLQAWAILIPLFVVVVICQMLANMGSQQPAFAEGFRLCIVTLATAWAFVWLVGFSFSSRHRCLAFAATFFVMLAVGLLSYVCDGRVLASESPVLSVYYLVFALALMLPMSLSSWCCRRVYRPRRFMIWLFLWTPLTLAGAMLLFVCGLTLFMGVTTGALAVTHIMIMAPVAALMGGIYGVFLYLLNLPFMLLAFGNSLYRERFCTIFGLQPAPAAEEAAISEKRVDQAPCA